jgi:hypothetical protein
MSPLRQFLTSALLLSNLATASVIAQTAPAQLQGKTALVTGSTDGLGREVAKSLAAAGAHWPTPSSDCIPRSTCSSTTSARIINVASLSADPIQWDDVMRERRDAVMFLITSPTIAAGAFYNGQTLATPHAQAGDAGARARLRVLSGRLTGIP